MKNFFCKKTKAGFTIIETMVSISLFLIIVMAGMTALLNANALHQKSRNMRSIMDSLSFIVEDISRNLREGYGYRCITADSDMASGVIATTISGQSCYGIAFESANGNKTLSTDQWVYVLGTKTIESTSVEGIFKSTDGASTFTALNPEEIVIDLTASSFSVLGAEPPSGDSQQPFVIIKLVGTITSKGIVTPFYLQTSASQRLIDVITGA